MSFLYKEEKTYKHKIYKICGLKFSFQRPRYKRQSKLFDAVDPKTIQKNGFSVVADFKNHSGETQNALDMLKIFKEFGIACEAVDIKKPTSAPKYYTKIAVSTSEYFKHKNYNNVSLLVWEFESGMLEARPYAFENIQTVLTTSTFCYNYFKKIIPAGVKLVHIPYPFDFASIPSKINEQTRAKYGIKPDDFVCFFNFAYSSSYHRKNPEAVLKAFALALKGQDNAKLFIKTSNSQKNKYRERFFEKIKEYGLQDQIIIEENSLNRSDMMDVINTSDVYLSLHRGEGVGLGMLEAMAMGKPVIATNYSGNTDFVKEGVAFPVSYKLVTPKENDLKVYNHVLLWAEPNIKEASEILLKLYQNPELKQNVGQKAKEFIKKEFDHKKIIKILREML